jgi:hypothetical protein
MDELDTTVTDGLIEVGKSGLFLEERACEQVRVQLARVRERSTLLFLKQGKIHEEVKAFCKINSKELVTKCIQCFSESIKLDLLQFHFSDMEQIIYHINKRLFTFKSWSYKLVVVLKKMIETSLDQIFAKLVGFIAKVPLHSNTVIRQPTATVRNNAPVSVESYPSVLNQLRGIFVNQTPREPDSEFGVDRTTFRTSRRTNTTSALSTPLTSPVKTSTRSIQSTVSPSPGSSRWSVSSRLIPTQSVPVPPVPSETALRVRLMYRMLRSLGLNKVISPIVSEGQSSAALFVGGSHYMTAGKRVS